VQAFEIACRGGDIEQAMRIYESALALRHDELILPEDEEFEVAMQCIKHAHYELGFQILQKLHMLRPDHPKTERILAKMVSICANKLARYEEAQGYFQELKKNHPQSKYVEMLKWDMNKVKYLVSTSS
jgi:tetratricopeptide (TPR) repeat protein